MTPNQIAEAQRLSREFRLQSDAGGSEDRGGVAAQLAASENLAGSGSGFFITDDGYLLTSAHVVEAGSNFKVMTATGQLPARLVKQDAANDIAILRAEGRRSTLPIAPSRGVRLGQSVVTIGFPNIGLQGFLPKVARGEIAGLSGAQDDPL